MSLVKRSYAKAIPLTLTSSPLRQSRGI